jgi:hypothetical protein
MFDNAHKFISKYRLSETFEKDIYYNEFKVAYFRYFSLTLRSMSLLLK